MVRIVMAVTRDSTAPATASPVGHMVTAIFLLEQMVLYIDLLHWQCWVHGDPLRSVTSLYFLPYKHLCSFQQLS